MNVVITLPKDLLEKIISGEKKFEMRKCEPKHMRIGVDGFFVVEKGSDDIRCWCRVDDIFETDISAYSTKLLASQLCVPEDYIEKYANYKKVYLWDIGKVKTFENLKRDDLLVDRNPQSFAYTPLSWGESL